ncbi:MAG: hypothetical protein ACI8ZX_000629 [Planctomycetota bacterium]|jgi:hypothetical protein
MKKIYLTLIVLILFSISSYAQSPKLSAYKNENKPPNTTYRIGSVSVAVWETEKEGKYGKYIDKSFKVVKSYKKDDKWFESNSYSTAELLKLKAVIDKAINEEAIKVKKQ